MNNLTTPDAGKYIVPTECDKTMAVDIGANSGIITRQLATQFSMVHAYEPLLFLFEKINLQKPENVTLYHEAVSNKLGETSVITHFNNDSGSCAIKDCVDNVIVKKHWTGNEVNKVNTVDLETVLSRCGGKINFLKMDCENSEFLILMNKDLTQIHYIAVELHNQMGEENYNLLKAWVSKTHSGFPNWNDDNQECLLVNKTLSL
jgi:FkbM family methyltransferase